MHGPGSGVPRGCGMRQWALACVLVAAACGGASQSNVRPLGGILTVAPATLDFGDVALGREQTQRVVLRNTGLVSMTVGQLAQFADPAFEVKGLPETLGPGSAVDVAVRYRPPGLGTHERMLQIVTDSPASNGADVDLRGHAVRGLATLSCDSFDFGPDVRNVLFANTNVGLCSYDERFLDPVLAALTDPLISSTKAPGTPWPNDGNAGFLRDDARLALLAVSDADDANDVVSPAPVSDYVRRLVQVKKGALDLISFAGIVPLQSCKTAEGIGARYMEIARQLNGHLEDICDLGNFGTLLESSLGNLLLPLTSFPLSALPKDPQSIAVTVNGAPATQWTYDAGSNRIVFPASAVPPPGAHITARYEPACL